VVSGKPASCAAISVSRWAAASNEAGTVTVISWVSNSKSGPRWANRLFHALLKWLRMTAEARKGESLLVRAMSSDPQGRNGAVRSDVWWQSQDFAEWMTRPGDSPAFFRASRPTIHFSLVAAPPCIWTAAVSSGRQRKEGRPEDSVIPDSVSHW